MHDIDQFTITHAELRRREMIEKRSKSILWLVGGGIALVAVAYAVAWMVNVAKWMMSDAAEWMMKVLQ